MQYRIGLAPLMSWATIAAIAKYKWLNRKAIAVYLVLCILAVQYVLHLPLSYLTKQWFWSESQAASNINKLITFIPENAAVVSQNNITSHVSHRYNIFTLWPTGKAFKQNSPCAKTTCNWFEWAGNPQYLIVDTSSDWDIRHLLANRENYVGGLQNLAKAGVIKKYKEIGNATLYRVLHAPD